MIRDLITQTNTNRVNDLTGGIVNVIYQNRGIISAVVGRGYDALSGRTKGDRHVFALNSAGEARYIATHDYGPQADSHCKGGSYKREEIWFYTFEDEVEHMYLRGKLISYKGQPTEYGKKLMVWFS